MERILNLSALYVKQAVHRNDRKSLPVTREGTVFVDGCISHTTNRRSPYARGRGCDELKDRGKRVPTHSKEERQSRTPMALQLSFDVWSTRLVSMPE